MDVETELVDKVRAVRATGEEGGGEEGGEEGGEGGEEGGEGEGEEGEEEEGEEGEGEGEGEGGEEGGEEGEGEGEGEEGGEEGGEGGEGEEVSEEGKGEAGEGEEEEGRKKRQAEKPDIAQSASGRGRKRSPCTLLRRCLRGKLRSCRRLRKIIFRRLGGNDANPEERSRPKRQETTNEVTSTIGNRPNPRLLCPVLRRCLKGRRRFCRLILNIIRRQLTKPQ